MKYSISALALTAGLSTAAVLQPRQATCSGCTTGITVSGGPGSGALGQLGDGQNRVGPGYAAASYCLTNGGFTDSTGRGCIITAPTTQFQCDTGATATTGFTVTASGAIAYNGDTTFYECAATTTGVYNIYTSPEGTNCSAVTLTATNSNCAAAASASSASVASASSASVASASSASVASASSASAASASASASSASVISASSASVASASSASVASASVASASVASASVASASIASASSASVASASLASIASASSASLASASSVSAAATPTPSATYGSCTGAVDICRTGANANQAACSAEYCECLASAGAAALAMGPSYCIVSTSSTVGPTTPITSPTVPATVGSTCIATPAYSSLTSAAAGNGGAGAGSTCIASSVYNSLTASSPATVTETQTLTVTSTETLASSAPVVATTPAAASTPAAATTPAASATGTGSSSSTPSGACAATLSGQTFEYPHLIVPVSSATPNTAGGTSYNGVISSTTSSIFNFDVPASYAGDTCTLVFLLPEESALSTSSYTLTGTGGIEVQQLSSPATQATTYNTVPSVSADLGTFTITAGSSTVIASGACAAGQTLSYEVSATGTFGLNYFQDYNPSAIGLYIVEC